jgi:hypothetical protein
MVGVTEISIVEEPDIADVEDLIVGAVEEFSEVLAGFEEISQPDHRGQVTVSSLQEVTSQLHLLRLLLVGCLYNIDYESAGIKIVLLALISLMAWRPIRGVTLLESANCFEI